MAGAAGSRAVRFLAQIRSVAERLGQSLGPMVVFAAATGLRPSELFALEQGDVDRACGVVQIRRAYANGRVKQTKTWLSRRAVPLQAIALEALDQLRPREVSPLLFPNTRGGYLDFRNFNRRHWKPVQHAVSLLDALALERRGRWVNVGPRARKAAQRHGFRASRAPSAVRPLTLHRHEHRDDRPRRPRGAAVRSRGGRPRGFTPFTTSSWSSRSLRRFYESAVLR